MNERHPPEIVRFPAAKQRQMDELLERNAEGTITPEERSQLKLLVAEAEQFMVANAKLLRNGVPTFPPDQGSTTVDLDVVNKLRDETP